MRRLIGLTTIFIALAFSASTFAQSPGIPNTPIAPVAPGTSPAPATPPLKDMKTDKKAEQKKAPAETHRADEAAGDHK